MATHAAWKSLLFTNFHLSLNLQAQSTTRRSLFYWLTIMFNNVDQKRVAEVGPDRACAEWLLKNGAAIKWKEDGTIISDYNALPDSIELPRKHIQAIDATNSAISHIGFPHFKNCNYLDEIKLVNCAYIEDPAIRLLSIAKETLKHVEISNCLNVSGKALLNLNKLINLKTLKIENMSHVDNKNIIVENLTEALPNCHINFK